MSARDGIVTSMGRAIGGDAANALASGATSRSWSSAVERWATHAYDLRPDGRFHAEMRRDADRLRAVRRYVKAPPPALDGPAEQLLAYFGGFFSGEGCFGLSGLVTDRPAIPRVRRASARQDMRRGTRISRFSAPSRPKASRTSSPRRRTRALARPTPTGRIATRSHWPSVAGLGRSTPRAWGRVSRTGRGIGPRSRRSLTRPAA